MNPRPSVAPTIRKLPAIGAADGTPPDEAQTPKSKAAAKEAAGTARPGVPASTVGRAQSTLAVGARPSAVTPLAPESYKIQFTMSSDSRARLTRVQDLLRHSVPTGDLAAVFDRALTALLNDLERRRCAVAARPREAAEAKPGSRHIPAAVRRAVWKRDEGRCAFVGSHGRCVERGFIEFPHREPFALGGASTSENIELRCRAHNAYEAVLAFGDFPDAVRETRNRWLAWKYERRHSNSFRNELPYSSSVSTSGRISPGR